MPSLYIQLKRRGLFERTKLEYVGTFTVEEIQEFERRLVVARAFGYKTVRVTEDFWIGVEEIRRYEVRD